MISKCPECGTSLDEVPFTRCRYHRAHEEDERVALQAKRNARPFSMKLEEAEDFDELRAHLVDYFRSIEP